MFNLRNELEISLLVWDVHARRWQQNNTSSMIGKIHDTLDGLFQSVLSAWKVFPDVMLYIRSAHLVTEHMVRAGMNVPFPVDFSAHVHAVIHNACDVYTHLFKDLTETTSIVDAKITCIQRSWRRCISDPQYKVCRRRLEKEYGDMCVH